MKPWNISPEVQKLTQIVIEKTKPKKLVLFGSRARGTHRENSDVDLCIFGRSCTEETWNRLLISIQDDPYTLLKIDLVEFEKLSEIYQNEIMKDGVTLYESSP